MTVLCSPKAAAGEAQLSGSLKWRLARHTEHSLYFAILVNINRAERGCGQMAVRTVTPGFPRLGSSRVVLRFDVVRLTQNRFDFISGHFERDPRHQGCELLPRSRLWRLRLADKTTGEDQE